MIGTAGLILQSYKRSAELASDCSKKARTIKDVCQENKKAVSNTGTVPYPTVFMLSEQDIGEEHVVEFCSELDDVEEVAGELDVVASDDNAVTNDHSALVRQDSSACSTISSDDTGSSGSVNSLSGFRRDDETEKAFQRKRKPLFVDAHSSRTEGLAKDTVWNEDEYKAEVSLNEQ
ncbi:hypothetical protein BIW11_00459 [Tropilaelaps mercedesae]|uniref:Uncharacterized protein n=1 Tax=Tropilaelaps mercedesae TaxID=418985 RepID=A0A1V9XV49_9ACAR|nr:hypothetical protein BIW11_00459 [Tropilaelaps mercedesae]